MIVLEEGRQTGRSAAPQQLTTCLFFQFDRALWQELLRDAAIVPLQFIDLGGCVGHCDCMNACMLRVCLVHVDEPASHGEHTGFVLAEEQQCQGFQAMHCSLRADRSCIEQLIGTCCASAANSTLIQFEVRYPCKKVM